MTSKPVASPACAVNEAPDRYLGYWTPAEVAAQLTALAATARRGGREDLAARLDKAMASLPAATAAAPKLFDLAAAFDQLLPKIRDDTLHAELKAIRDAL